MLELFLLATVILPQISESVFSPCLPDIAQYYSETMSSVEHVFTTYLIGYSLGMLIWGGLSDFLGRIKTLRIGIGVYLLGSILCLKASTLSILLLSRVLQGVGGSSCSVLVITMCRDYFEGDDRAKMMAKIGMAISIGPMLGPVMGASILIYADWYYVYFPLLAYACLIFGSTRFISSRITKVIEPNIKDYVSVLKNKIIWVYALLIGSACGIGFTFFSEAPSFFMTSLGMPEQYYGMSFVLVGVAWYIGGKISHFLLNFYSVMDVMKIGGVMALIFSTLFCLVVYSIQSIALLVILSWLCVFCIMTSLGLVIGNAFTLALEPFSHCSGIAASILGFLYYGVISLDAALMAELHNGTIYVMPVFWLIEIGFCVSLIFLLHAWGMVEHFQSLAAVAPAE